MDKVKILLFFMAIFFWTIPKSYALDYFRCEAYRDVPACQLALLKLRSMKNPRRPNNFFENGLHFLETGELIKYPALEVAEADLDNDGIKEIIIAIPETDDLMYDHYCSPINMCMHYILQDRNPDPTKMKLSNLKMMGPIYTTGLGLSTDEVFGGFKSLRAYRDLEYTEFDVYQYDNKTDAYYNITIRN